MKTAGEKGGIWLDPPGCRDHNAPVSHAETRRREVDAAIARQDREMHGAALLAGDTCYCRPCVAARKKDGE